MRIFGGSLTAYLGYRITSLLAYFTDGVDRPQLSLHGTLGEFVLWEMCGARNELNIETYVVEITLSLPSV